MIAVIEVGWNQYIVQKGDVIDVTRFNYDSKGKVTLDPLLVSDVDGKDVKIWTPTVSWAKVELKVIEDLRWDKVRVFKMKSKKRYTRNKSDRALLTKLEVTDIK